MFTTQNYIIKDFSGGITDEYIDGEPRHCLRGNNFALTTNNKIDTRYGSEIQDETLYVIPAGNQRISEMVSAFDELFIQSARNFYYRDVTWKTVTGPTGNPVFSTGTTASRVNHGLWNNHVFLTNTDYASPQKIYFDGTDWKSRNAGLPLIAAVTDTHTAGANNYIYALHYSSTYVTQGITFLDYAQVRQYAVDNSDAPNVNAVTINLPTLANGLTENYDTANLKIAIYRTENNGTVFYKLGEVTNGTASYVDSLSDALLVDNELLYTQDGTVEEEQAPKSRYFHIVEDIGYYGDVLDTGEYLTFRLRQSIPSKIGASPAFFYLDLEAPIKGLSSFQSFPIVFCESRMYRIEGFYDELGRGGMQKADISTVVGCINSKSIVQTPMGVFFWGKDGVYMTDARSVQKLNVHLPETYKNLTESDTKRSNIYGVYDVENSRVIWGCQENSASLDADICLVLELKAPMSEKSTFFKWEGGESWAPTALAFFEKKLIRADKRGYTFTHDSEFFSDPQVDTSEFPVDWSKQPITFDYISCALDMQNPDTRKWATKMVIAGKNKTNVNIQVSSCNDDSGVFQNLSVIRHRSNIVWGDPEVVWGDDEVLWNYVMLIEEERRFPANKLRFSYKQIRITNADAILYTSDALGVANINSTLKTVFLTTSPTVAWPLDSRYYYIAFEADGYTQKYLITNRTNTTLTYSDPSNLSVTAANSKYQITGVAKDEVLSLTHYIVRFAPISDTIRNTSGTTGANS